MHSCVTSLLSHALASMYFMLIVFSKDHSGHVKLLLGYRRSRLCAIHTKDSTRQSMGLCSTLATGP
jgi:hypothetical protein